MTLVSGLNSMPFIGQDVGGYSRGVTEELLVRWFQLGAWVYPFYRSHNSINAPHKEPWVFPHPTSDRLIKSINDRYLLIGVWYTHAVYATRSGRGPVVPLWFDWPEIDSFHDNDKEVILGDSLLVVPVMAQGATTVEVIKPPGYWYEFESGQVIKANFNRSVTLDDIPVYVRGGRIVPVYKSHGETALGTIVTPLTLVIALDEKGGSEGSIYLDDGVSFDYSSGKFVHRNFTFKDNVLKFFKGCTFEREVPELLKNAIVSSLDIFHVLPDGSSHTEHITGLSFKISEEWSWTWHREIFDGASVGSEKGCVIIWGFVGSVIVVSCIVGVIVVRRKKQHIPDINAEPLVK
jgi:alpha-glucosidase (family GH31 glycosyl hydrolase)